jgi:YfiH family protein
LPRASAFAQGRTGLASSTTTKKAASKRPAVKRKTAAAIEWNLRRAGSLQILEAPSLARLDWLVHGFSTRPGGASELKPLHDGRESSEKVLNLGFTDWDVRERVLKNREKFFRASGAAEMRVVMLRQIHSDIVQVVQADGAIPATANDSGKATLQGDALITRERGVLLVVQIADCIPILLADTKRRAVAAIHSGWRGTVQRIAEKALGRMQMEFGTKPQDVVAAIGPGIAQSCYEVGTEVAAEFHVQFPNAPAWFEGPFDRLADSDNDPNWLPWLTMKPPGHAPPSPRVQLDLIAANRSILATAGIPARNISASGFCTSCRSDLFFSFRKERATGRMMAAIGIR